MKKFSAIILCCLLLITGLFTGCATFSIDKVKYYNEVLATVGSTNITRFELLNAFNSYGSSYYMEQLGEEESEAISHTLDLLIDRESLYQYAKDYDKYRPTAYQINKSINSMFESLNNSFKEYTKSAKKILGLKITEDDTEDENNETAYIYKDFTDNDNVRAVIELDENSNYHIVYTEQKDPEYTPIINQFYLENFQDINTIQKIIDKYFETYQLSLVNETKQEEIYQKAISLFSHDLINYEYYLRDDNNKPYNTVSDDLIYRYFKRNYESQIKSAYLENIQTVYLKTSQDLKINKILEKYTELYNYSYNKYKNSATRYNSDLKDIGASGDTVLYHLPTDAEFGYFGHTLLSYDTDTKNRLSALDKEYKNNKNDKYYTKYWTIIKDMKLPVRDAETGLITIKAEDDNAPTIEQVLNEYQSTVIDASKNAQLKNFIAFMYKYTGDTATLSGGMPYVVGKGEGNSAMETAFTEEAIRLIDDAKDKGITSGNFTTEISNVKNMCITSYGIHVLYYFGNVNSFDLTPNAVNDAYLALVDRVGNSNNLYTTEINPITHETYFDMLFDEVYPTSGEDTIFAQTTGYDQEENKILTASRKKYAVVKYTTKINGTKTSI